MSYYFVTMAKKNIYTNLPRKILYDYLDYNIIRIAEYAFDVYISIDRRLL